MSNLFHRSLENQSLLYIPSLSDVIHNPQHYARDFYFFKRSQYPQLSLTHKKPQAAYNELQAQCFGLKFVEMGTKIDSHEYIHTDGILHAHHGRSQARSR